MIRFHEALEPLMVDIDEVSQHPDNPNNGDTDRIGNSIDINGMFRPVVTQASTGYILDGNHTYVSCLERGATRIPVIALDVDDIQALQILIAANEIASHARRDPGAVMRLYDQIVKHVEDPALAAAATGLDNRDLEHMRSAMEAPFTPADAAGGFGGQHIPSGITCPECGHSW